MSVPTPTQLPWQVATPAPTSLPVPTISIQTSPAVFAAAGTDGAGASNTRSGPKVVDKAAKVEYDITDALAGTGIDLADEERIAAEFYGSSHFDPVAKLGFPQLKPGPQSLFYGAGPARLDASQHEKYAELVAQWDAHASKLQALRTAELRKPCANASRLQTRIHQLAMEDGLAVHSSVTGKETGVVQHHSQDSLPSSEADKVVLVSLGLETYLRDLLEESYRFSRHRQLTTHGPSSDWIGAVQAPPVMPLSSNNGVAEGSVKKPRVSSGHTNQSLPSLGAVTEVKLPNEVILSLREMSRSDRSLEEKRLARRQQRQKDPTPGSLRSSVGTGVSGSAITEMGLKPPSKKEMRKQQKLAEQASAASVNSTTSHFLSSGRKDKRKYSWMIAASSNSAVNRGGSVAAGTLSGLSAGPAGNSMMTAEGRYRLGSHREDGLSGAKVQLRDLVSSLENSLGSPGNLQVAYLKLDGPKTTA